MQILGDSDLNGYDSETGNSSIPVGEENGSVWRSNNEL
jgi:hypothetical protein